MKHTELFEKYRASGAKFIDFGGWEMPLEYSGVVKEHEAVRNTAGLFDISHMGAIEVGGDDGIAFLGKVLTLRPETIEVDRAKYAFLLNEKGGTKDDLMVFRLNEKRFLLVVNASTKEKDLAWLRQNAAGFAAAPIDDSPDTAILAVQGPASWEIVSKVFGIEPKSIKYHGFVNSQFEGTGYILSRTGYTGERGFEIFIHRHTAGKLWDALMDAGRGFGLVPCGLGARDTLRLEMGYLLYGNDIDEDTSPIEAGYEGAIDFENTDFIGRDALLKVKEKGPGKRLIGLLLKDHGVPRHGCKVMAGGSEAGVVTSGNFSPSFKKGIAMAYVNTGVPLEDIKIDIRGKLHVAELAEFPFYKKK